MSGRNAGSAQQTAQILDLGTQEVDSGDNDGNRAFIDAAVVIKRHADTNKAPPMDMSALNSTMIASPGRPQMAITGAKNLPARVSSPVTFKILMHT